MKDKEIYDYKKLILESFLVTKNKKFSRVNSELKNRIFRRSIFTIKSIKKGEKFSPSNIKIVRPGYGLEPRFFHKILGKKSKTNLPSAIPLKSNYILNFKI